MKNLFKAALLLLLPLVVSCSKEQTVTIKNESKSQFYIMTEKQAKHITGDKAYSMHSSGEIELADSMGSYTHISHGTYLDNFAVDSSYVFCFVAEADLEKPVKGKSRTEYKTLVIPSADSEHLTSVTIMIKDSLGKPEFTSTLKYKQGI